MAEHTPGPWKIVDEDIHSESGVHVVCFGHDYDDYGGIYADTALDGVEWADGCLANARLIAAAPDLLEALKRLDEGCRVDRIPAMTCPVDSCACIGCMTRRAILKAEGR